MKGAQNRVGSSGRGSSQSSWVDPRLIVLATLVLGAVLTAFAAQAPQPKPADQQGRQEGKDQAQASSWRRASFCRPAKVCSWWKGAQSCRSSNLRPSLSSTRSGC